MSNRLCGYCRAGGHTSRVCPTRLGQIEEMRRHVGRQRLELIQHLKSSGFGEGALVSGYDWGLGNNVTMMITDMNRAVADYHNSLWESKNIKYSKQSRLTLRCIASTTPDSPLGTRFVHYHSSNEFYVIARPLEAPNREVACYFRLNALTSCERSRHSDLRYYSWERNSELLVPSYDGEIDMAIVNATFRLPDRLGGQHAAPILP